MKHIKLFEEFGFDDEFDEDEAAQYDDYHSIEKFPKKEFDKPTEPKKPYKRSLTDKESEFMRNAFPNHSFTLDIDADGFIILGGGEGPLGKFYITEDDLVKFMAEEVGE